MGVWEDFGSGLAATAMHPDVVVQFVGALAHHPDYSAPDFTFGSESGMAVFNRYDTPPETTDVTGITTAEPACTIATGLYLGRLVSGLDAGGGLVAKAPGGTWTASDHVANFSLTVAGGAAKNSPWISTSRLPEVARAFDSGHGIAAIDLSKVPSLQVEVWRFAPRVNGPAGLAYHRSILAQEVTVFQSIPAEALVGRF